MIKKIFIDLSDLHTKEDIFWLFMWIFQFPIYFWHNWDGFFDILSSLEMSDIHLVLLGFDIFKKNFPSSDFDTFLSVFSNLSLNSDPEGMHFSFSIQK